MDDAAIVLAEGAFRTSDAKTAHGLVRGPARWPIAAVVDSTCAGAEAGALLDGRARGIPIVPSIADALSGPARGARWCVVGVATHGGRLPAALRASLLEAAESGLSIVNGLHELVQDDERIVAACARHGARIVDIRKPRPVRELSFWTGESTRLLVPRVAVLGTDCALGKRTTTQFLVAECRRRGLRAAMVHTGQTGWMQGVKHGFILDTTPNDFVSGELERALLACARDEDPQVVFLEGQSALRNPAGPCGAELLLSGGARQVVLQHAPARRWYDGTEQWGCAIPPVSDEIDLIARYGAEVVGLALNTEGLSNEAARAEARRLEAELGRPVVLPVEEGVGRLVDRISVKET
ncbi:MAG: hypothetical protein RL112_255 [Planctomycetota bacterium]|jgi:uncharacterized NAD-dependent epimerase/dehydratase family protein